MKTKMVNKFLVLALGGALLLSACGQAAPAPTNTSPPVPVEPTSAPPAEVPTEFSSLPHHWRFVRRPHG